jgi:arylsulfatase A-like enzyme
VLLDFISYILLNNSFKMLRSIVYSSFPILAIFPALDFATAATVAATKPHILMLMADQLRFDAVGAYGNPGVKTPNLDWLASRGIRFSSAYSSTPTCTPARAALLTGRSPWYHGMLGYGDVAPRYPYEMPRAMADDGGYYTAAIGEFRLQVTL